MIRYGQGFAKGFAASGDNVHAAACIFAQLHLAVGVGLAAAKATLSRMESPLPTLAMSGRDR